MQLSNKEKCFVALLKSGLNFEHFEKKMTLIAHVFPKLRIVKDVVRQMSKKTRFRAPFDSQHVKECQTLLKSVQKHFVKCLSQ